MPPANSPAYTGAVPEDHAASSDSPLDQSVPSALRFEQRIAELEAELGALQKDVIDTNTNSLSVALENVTASESAIRDTDFATKTAALTRAQVLVQANTSVLAQANATPQNVLALLKG